jgi:hypothetical protein
VNGTRAARAIGSEPPLVLALLRIAVGVIVLLSPEPEVARAVASHDPAIWVYPHGLSWLGAVVPLTPGSIALATRLLQTSAVLTILGLATRPALVLLAASLLYVFGAAQLTGTVTHDMHLFWFAAILAATPRGSGPGDALSLDQLWRRASLVGQPPTGDASLTTFTARLWLGLVYFFPGVWKLVDGGASWLGGETLRGQMYFKWYEAGGVVPWPRIDGASESGLLRLAAIGIVLFELGMPLLVSFRRTRPIAIVCGLGFHLAAGHFLDVLFPSLIACYVILLPGDRIRARLLAALPGPAAQPPSSSRTGRTPTAIALGVVGATFTAGIVWAGARGQTQSYPFACYPTFATPAPTAIVDLAVEVAGAGDEDRPTFRLPRRRRQDEWGMVWRLAGLYGDPIDRGRLDAFARLVVPPELSSRPRRWMLESYDVRPEAYGAPPLARWPIAADPSLSEASLR